MYGEIKENRNHRGKKNSVTGLTNPKTIPDRWDNSRRRGLRIQDSPVFHVKVRIYLVLARSFKVDHHQRLIEQTYSTRGGSSITTKQIYSINRWATIAIQINAEWIRRASGILGTCHMEMSGT